jgi:hypothetical protein
MHRQPPAKLGKSSAKCRTNVMRPEAPGDDLTAGRTRRPSADAKEYRSPPGTANSRNRRTLPPEINTLAPGGLKMRKFTRPVLNSVFLAFVLAGPSLAAEHRHAVPLRFLGTAGLQGNAVRHEIPAKAPAKSRRPSCPNASFCIFDVPGSEWTLAYGINAGGYIVGEFGGSDGHTHGFLRAPDNTFTIVNVGTVPTSGFWINDRNEMTGNYLKGGIQHAYLRKPQGKILRFEPQDTQHTDGLHINNKGQATGDYQDSNGLWHGFIRAKDGSLTTFEEPLAGTDIEQGTYAGATNVKGDTIGPYVDAGYVLHGYVRHSGNGYEEFDVPGALDTIPFIINAKGWIVGLSDEESGATHGFIRKPNGQIIAVDAPDAGSGPGQGTAVNDINVYRVATGNYVDANDVSHGFVRRADKTLQEFDVPGADGGTWPISINAGGTISGFIVDADGVPHGFVGTL